MARMLIFVYAGHQVKQSHIYQPLTLFVMAESVYKIIELVGTSTESWEKAAEAAVKKASKSLRDLRIAEVSQMDLQLNDGKIEAYRVKVKVSFRYED
jgi:flavin-binding protein dodecin